MMRLLIGRAEKIAATFNAQDVTNTLWAFGSMGRVPGEWLMETLGGRLEEITATLSSQGVASALWSMQRWAGSRAIG